MLTTTAFIKTTLYPGILINNSLLLPAAVAIALVVKFFAVRYVSRASNLQGMWITVIMNAFSLTTLFFAIPYIIQGWEWLYTHLLSSVLRWDLLKALNWVFSVGLIAFTYALIEFIVLWMLFRSLLLKNRTLLWLLFANLTTALGAIYVALGSV